MKKKLIYMTHTYKIIILVLKEHKYGGWRREHEPA